MRNSATYYLQRYPATTSRFRRVMLRKIDRSLAFHGGERDEAEELLDTLVQQLTEAGWLDDARFVQARVEELHRKGTSRRGIQAMLMQQGGPSDLVRAALDSLEGDPELAAAVKVARRKRLGPYQPTQERRQERKQKDLAAMARAGFSYGIARRVLDADEEELIELEGAALAGG